METLAYETNSNGTVKTGKQIAQQYQGDKMAVRHCLNGAAWSAWESFVKNTDLASDSLENEDLNSIQVPGNYVQISNSNATTAKHYPANVAGHLEVAATLGRGCIMQRYTVYNTGAVYIRCLYDGSWYSWSGPK